MSIVCVGMWVIILGLRIHNILFMTTLRFIVMFNQGNDYGIATVDFHRGSLHGKMFVSRRRRP